ncbi:hypothetical protein BH23ACT11_BH23ACT11_05990 [soil metagenome]
MGDHASGHLGPLHSPILREARILGPQDKAAESNRLSIEILEGPLRGRRVPGFFGWLGVPPKRGEIVLVNTVGLEMELGTGGAAMVFPSSGGIAPRNENHFVKLPYTPLQCPASPPVQAENLAGVPVVVLPLHSHLAPACCAAADVRSGSRVSFVWQEGGALPVALSETVNLLRERGLLRSVVSAGNCFGGDVEAPNIYSGLLAATANSDIVLVGIGPGAVGTGAPYGHGGMSAATALNAACALGAQPVLAPRISAADSRRRHLGFSHHTRSVLRAALGGIRVALPPSASNLSTDDFPQRHGYAESSYDAAGLEARFGVTFASMGRTYSGDRVFFDCAAAAVALALKETG